MSQFITGGGHFLAVDLPEDLQRVMADPGHIVQVLNNLFSNAARHSPESSPIRVADARDGLHVATSATDRGRGVPPDRLLHLFRNTAARRQARGERRLGGSGLGMSICKGLVETHGGRIRAESGAKGRGATRARHWVRARQETWRASGSIALTKKGAIGQDSRHGIGRPRIEKRVEDLMVQYAGFWRRAMAALIDAILIGGVCLLIIGSGVLERSDGVAALAIVSLIAGPLAYHAACEATSWRGSAGKRLMGLHVLDLKGQELELGRAVLRNAGKVLSALVANVGFAAAGFTSRKQALHDVLAGAVVVRGPLPEAAGFERQVLADYRPGQDRMRSLGVLALLAAAGLAAFLVAGSTTSGTRGGNGNSLQNLAPPPEPADIEILRTARTLRCDFDDMPSDTVIDGVNHGTGFGEARILGNVGASDAVSVLGREMVSFIEFLPNAVNTITVYASKDNELRFVAVYSRHNAILGAPTPSQQRGSCQVLG